MSIKVIITANIKTARLIKITPPIKAPFTSESSASDATKENIYLKMTWEINFRLN